jgi:hypothetical protein
MRKLKSSSDDLPASVTVNANGETQISFTVKLDSEETAKNLEIFNNGFFVDGYVFLSSDSGEVTDISIPFSGFYGSWAAAPVLDGTYYSDNLLGQTYLGLIDYTQNVIYPLGENRLSESDDEAGSESLVAISPSLLDSSTGVSLSIATIRKSKPMSLAIKDSGGNVVFEEKNDDKTEKFITYWFNLKEGVKNLADGDYTLTVTAEFDYENSREETEDFSFYIDSVKPDITEYSLYEEDGKRYISMTVSDDKNIMGVSGTGTMEDGSEYQTVQPVYGGESADLTFDITDTVESTLVFTAVDYAGNERVLTFGGIDAVLAGEPVSGSTRTSMTFNVVNNTGSEVSGDIIAVLYDRDGAITGVSVKQDVTMEWGSTPVVFDFANTSYDTVRLFIFDSLDEMHPLRTDTNVDDGAEVNDGAVG